MLEGLGRCLCIKMPGKVCSSVRKNSSSSSNGRPNNRSSTYNGGLEESRRIMLSSQPNDGILEPYDRTPTAPDNIPNSIGQQNNHCNSRDVQLSMYDVERRYAKLDRQFGELKRALQSVVDNTITRDNASAETCSIVREWRLLARVIDRFCIIAYFFAVTASLFTLFPRPED